MVQSLLSILKQKYLHYRHIHPGDRYRTRPTFINFFFMIHVFVCYVFVAVSATGIFHVRDAVTSRRCRVRSLARSIFVPPFKRFARTRTVQAGTDYVGRKTRVKNVNTSEK